MWRDQPVSRGACAEHSDATLLQKSCMQGDIYLSVLARLFYSPCCVKSCLCDLIDKEKRPETILVKTSLDAHNDT